LQGTDPKHARVVGAERFEDDSGAPGDRAALPCLEDVVATPAVGKPDDARLAANEDAFASDVEAADASPRKCEHVAWTLASHGARMRVCIWTEQMQWTSSVTGTVGGSTVPVEKRTD
jgi:hypothetical protein